MVLSAKPFIQWDVHVFDELKSTQDTAREALLNGGSAGYVVRALMQSSGRGRHGRVWQGLPGNLFFSFIIEPSRPMTDWGSLSLLTGLALAKSLGRGDAMLKWPNDVLLDDRKCAGILIEVEGDAVIIGAGVNVASAPEGFAFLGGDADDILMAFLTAFNEVYSDWEQGGFAAVKDEWLSYAHAAGRVMQVKLPSGNVDGIFAGVTDDGALLLERANGSITTVTAGELILGL